MTTSTTSTNSNQIATEYQSNSNPSQETQRSPLLSLIDSINLSNLNEYYNNKNDILFKKRIDKLNITFYLESEKISNFKTKEEIEKSHIKLFIILFKQISLYIEEIERLNKMIIFLTDNNNNTIKEGEITIRTKENNIYHNIISNLRASNKLLERKINEKAKNEERNQIEIQSLKRQINFYKDKMKLEIPNAIVNSVISKRREDNTQKTTGSNLNKSINSPITSNKTKRDISNSPINHLSIKYDNDKKRKNTRNELVKRVPIVEKSKGNTTMSYESKLMSNNTFISKSIEHNEEGILFDNSTCEQETKTLIKYCKDEIDELNEMENLLKREVINNNYINNDIDNFENNVCNSNLLCLSNKKQSGMKGNNTCNNNSLYNFRKKAQKEKLANLKENMPLFTTIKIDL